MNGMTALSIEERLQWARRQGHPAYLWPEIPMAHWRAALLAIEEAISAVMRVPPPAATFLAPPGEAGAAAIGVAAFTSGTGPLLGHWVETGRLRVPPDLAHILGEHLAHARRRALRVESVLARVLAALAEEGVKPTVLKGAHTAHAYFPEPGARPIADIDLSVGGDQVPAVAAAMTRLGYLPRIQRARPYRCDWIPPGPELPRRLDLTHEENPLAIEVHAGLDRDFGVRRLPFSNRETGLTEAWTAFGDALVPAEPLLFAYLAAHASEELHRMQMLRLVELVLVARRDFTSPAHWEALQRFARELGACRFLYPAMALAEALVPESMNAEALADFERDAPPRLRRAIARLRPATAFNLERLSVADRFIWTRGPVETVRRAAYLLFPDRSRSLAAIYAERLWRVLRGRISFR